MDCTRRNALRAGGGLLATGLAGCIEERVTRRESVVDSTVTWALSPAIEAAVDADAFEGYVDRMRDRYGDAGVWGLEAERPTDLETAYVQRLAIARESPSQPGGTVASLDPEAVDPDAPLLFGDAAIAIYRVGEDRYRHWLWAAVDAAADPLIRDVDAATLGARSALQSGVLTDSARITRADDVASVDLDGPPSARFPLADGTEAVDTNSTRGRRGEYLLEWTGAVDGRQSINGVCEVERTGDHDLLWSVTIGYRTAELV